MKKLSLFIISMLAFAAVAVQAQERYCWDFTQGFTSSQISWLDADGNWSKIKTDAEGNTTEWQNANNDIFGEDGLLMADGNVLFEDLRISMGTSTQAKGNITVKRSGQVRLTRNDMRIILPPLYNGQTVTITAKSANASATNRGIAIEQGNLELISGQTTDGQYMFLGHDVEGSLGTYTFVWKVVSDNDEPQPVEFSTLSGGIDFLTIAVNLSESERSFYYDNVEYWTNDEVEGEAVAVGVKQLWGDQGWYYPETVVVREEVVNPFDGKSYRVTTMSPGAFNREGIKRVELPNSITEIPDAAFENNSSLESILLPGALTRIGTNAFQRCTALRRIYISTLADNIEVGQYAFRYCTSLEEVEMYNITAIPHRMFSDCTNLKRVILPSTCQTIGQASFASTALTSVVIPATVTKIDQWAFYDCASLQSVMALGTTPARIYGETFGGNDQLAATTLYVPENSLNAYKTASIWNIIGTAREIVNIDTPDQFTATSGKGFYYLQNVATGQFVTFSGNRAILGDQGTEFRAGGPFYYDQSGIYTLHFNIVFTDDFKGYNSNGLFASAYDGGVYSDNSFYSLWLLVKGDQEGTVRLRYDLTDPVLGPQRGYLTADLNTSPYEVNANGGEDDLSLWRLVTADELVQQQPDGLYAEAVSARPGTTVELPIMINNTSGIQGAQFDIQLPEGVSIVKNGRSWPVTINEQFAWGFNVSAEDKGNGHYRFVFTSQDPLTDAQGKLADITLTLADGMALGDYDITISAIELSTKQNEAVRPMDATTKLTVKSYTPGDVNDDGIVTVTDATATINYMLGKNPANFNYEAADIVRDGIINVSDVTAIIYLVLGK